MDKKESSFMGLVGVPFKGWKETDPWKRKFKICVKVNIYFKLCICLKGYFHYKTISSQNEPSEAKVKNFFCFTEKLSSILDIFKFLYF